MKNMKYLILLWLVSLLGCVDDDSRYGDIEIDEITIEGIEAYQEIDLGGRLRATPTVTTKFGEDSDLSYVWYKYDSGQSVADTLSFEKDLDVAVGDVMPGQDITLIFKVTDNRTGVYSTNRSVFKANSVYSGGTLILYANGGQRDLAMLKNDGKTLYENIYSLANHEKLGNQAKRLFLTHAYTKNPAAYKAVIVACDDATGGVYLDPDALIRKSYMREKFMFGSEEYMPDNLVITGVSNSTLIEYLIANGKVHGRTYSQSEVDARYQPEYVLPTAPSDYEVAAAVAQPWGEDKSPMYYDNLHGRFVVNLSGGGYLDLPGGRGKDFSQFDPTDMGENVRLMATGSNGTRANRLEEVWALMKNTATGQYSLITYKIETDWSTWPTSSNFISKSNDVIAPGSCPGMYAAEAFVAGNKYSIPTNNRQPTAPGILRFLFYLSGNKIYAFNVESQAEGVIIDGAAEGYVITGLDCTQVSIPTENGVESVTQLTLAVKDQGVSGKQGGIATYRLEQIGGLSARKMYARTGFCDEVIATVEKYD